MGGYFFCLKHNSNSKAEGNKSDASANQAE